VSKFGGEDLGPFLPSGYSENGSGYFQIFGEENFRPFFTQRVFGK
jgi:hypothetical protein